MECPVLYVLELSETCYNLGCFNSMLTLNFYYFANRDALSKILAFSFLFSFANITHTYMPSHGIRITFFRHEKKTRGANSERITFK
jgi:hypothetical protein